MDNSIALFLCSLFLSMSIFICNLRINDLEKEIEQIKETNIVCEVEKKEV